MALNYNDGIPDDFDVVVIGTGLPESILASACARIGLTVLHLDSNDYYGDCWASFNLEQLQKWVDDQQQLSLSFRNSTSASSKTENPIEENTIALEPNEKLVDLTGCSRQSFRNVQFEWILKESVVLQEKSTTESNFVENSDNSSPSSSGFVEQQQSDNNIIGDNDESHASKWTKDKVLNEWRRFSIDLTPKILLSRGEMVNLLIDSNVGRYAEFKTINRILTEIDNVIKVVPCSRADVFQSNEITVVEKRMLMKFLNFCLNFEDATNTDEFRNQSFETFLNKEKLTPLVRHYIFNALAMVSKTATAYQGLKSIKEFLMSAGRYGSSPFLWTVYGSGELPQCFCRLCAVFGGVYCLRSQLDTLVMDENTNKISAVVMNGRRITCRTLISNVNRLPCEFLPSEENDYLQLARATLLTDKSLLPSEREHISLLNISVDILPEPVRFFEVGHNGMVCPDGLFLVHVTALVTKTSGTARECLTPVLENFFHFNQTESSEKPNVLWALYFNQSLIRGDGAPAVERLPTNLLITDTPDSSFNYESIVTKVRHLFNEFFPDSPFLEPRPDQNDEDTNADAQHSDPGINGFTPDPPAPAHHSGEQQQRHTVDQQNSDSEISSSAVSDEIKRDHEDID